VETRLGELAQGMALILVPAYFHCANLCGVVRASLFLALEPTGLQAGRDYVLAVLSIDPAETSSDARHAKSADLAAFALPGDAHWHYLTGSAQNIQAVIDAVGFRERRDQRSKQFIHPAGLVFLTPKGIVSSYLLGMGYTSAQVRTAIGRAREGGVATRGSPLLLLCFHFDETTGRYSLEIMKLIRLAALLTVVTVAGVLFLLFRRERPKP
jgi:protein SCO1/2